MNKVLIKSFSVWARKAIIKEIEDKAYLLGITKNKIYDLDEDKDNNYKLSLGENISYKISKDLKISRDKMIDKIRTVGFCDFIEEVAYTYFNRVIAIRFMEINDYLPSKIRVLSSSKEDKFEPDIITNWEFLDFEVDKDKVKSLKLKNNIDELFSYLFIKQCDSLNDILPGLFRKIDNDGITAIFPVNLSNENSFIRRLVKDIDEKEFLNNVEIIGWMYQYYILEKKDDVFRSLKNNVKISKENIPAATQLFTPKWIVKYMIENSILRLYKEANFDKEFINNFKYFVHNSSDIGVDKFKNINIEDIKIIDPCMGSGHILVYAFDVFYEIYKSLGYMERDIPYIILEKNLYGIDLDNRAYQLAYFALMMKGRSKNRRFFRSKNISLNLCFIEESNSIYDYVTRKLRNIDISDDFKKDILYLLDEFYNAKEYGSLIKIKNINFNELREVVLKNFNDYKVKNIFLSLIVQGSILCQKYHVVVTNPPYMGSRGMGNLLTSFLKENYPNSKMDLFSVFIERGFEFTIDFGFNVMLTMQSWMFLHKFERFRRKLFNESTIISLLHMDNNVMGIAFGTSATVFRKCFIKNYDGLYNYIKLEDLNELGEPKTFPIQNNYNVNISLEKFKDIPGYPLNYWISENARKAFKDNKCLSDFYEPRQGMATTDNDEFVRYWYELDKDDINFNCQGIEDISNSFKVWFPYNKGGDYRKWYGNNEYVVKYEQGGKILIDLVKKKYPKISDPEFVIKNRKFYFKKGITWSLFGFKNFGVRYKEYGFIFDVSGSSLFPDDKYLNYILGFLCSNVCFYLLSSIAPTVNFQIGNIGDLPLILEEKYLDEIDRIVYENVEICKKEWDFYETSWDFKNHPAIIFRNDNFLETSFNNFSNELDNMFNKLKENEKRLNIIFKDIYGFSTEVSDYTRDEDISIRKVDNKMFCESFISYFVGCLFGRYSLDYEYVVENSNKIFEKDYKKFNPIEKNIAIIFGEEYFEDDIVKKFCEFLEVIFSKDSLICNLKFICESLNYKDDDYLGRIRDYFYKEFFKSHMKIYSKRCLYFQYFSGENNGVSAISYIHRFSNDDINILRLNYVLKIKRKYEESIARLESISGISKTLKTMKEKESLILKLNECIRYDELLNYASFCGVNLDKYDGIKTNYNKLKDICINNNKLIK